jgi:AcrR family transcriptional regulator
MSDLKQIRIGSPPGTRAKQREETRARLLDVAIKVLIEEGVARTTTLEVQKRAEVSRGALLHHFPTHAELLSATVALLVHMNEAAIWQEAAALSSLPDPIERAIRTLANAFAHPSFAAELELWAVARTDAGLRQSLRNAERQARDSRDRVLAELFAPLGDHPRIGTISELSTEFVRGLTLSTILREDESKRNRLVNNWIEVSRCLIGVETGR